MPVRELNATAPNFRGHLRSGKWTLCIGAGVSRGIVPTWQELTRRLVNETFATTFSEMQFSDHCTKTGWSLDGWIQACANHYKANFGLEEFYNLIEKHIYSDLRKKAADRGLEQVLVRVLGRPKNCSRQEVEQICAFFETEYGHTSLMAVSRSLLKLLEEERLPEAIISFNADTLLHTLLELLQRKQHYSGPLPHSHPEYAFKTVLRPLDSSKLLTPIYHCHGAIKPNTQDGVPPRDSRDRLVFLESEYIQIATTASSWAETLFMFHAQTTKMLCLGFSMSDPNMRRWFALSNQSAVHDVAALQNVTQISPRHVWVTTIPDEPSLRAIMNIALVHLGVRPGWIRDWNDVQAVFDNLFSL